MSGEPFPPCSHIYLFRCCSRDFCHVFCCFFFPQMPHLRGSPHLLRKTFDVSPQTCAPCPRKGTCTHGSAENGAIPTQPGPVSIQSMGTSCLRSILGGSLPGAIRHRVLLPWGRIWGSSCGASALGTACPCQDLHTPPAHRSSLGWRSPSEVCDGVPRGCCCQGCGRCYERSGTTQHSQQRIQFA